MNTNEMCIKDPITSFDITLPKYVKHKKLCMLEEDSKKIMCKLENNSKDKTNLS